MKQFILMLTFLTRIPVPFHFDFTEEDFAKGTVFIPVIGLIIGIILYGISLLTNNLDAPIQALIIWSIYILITGGLHIDGLADTIDGLFSSRDKNRMLEIMQDSRIGTFGVIVIGIVFYSNCLLSRYIEPYYLIIIPVVGRSCALLACSISSYAKERGMGKAIVEKCDIKITFFSILIFSIMILFFPKTVIPIIMIIILTLVLTKYIHSKIRGITGDSIGFIIESTQTLMLFLLYLI